LLKTTMLKNNPNSKSQKTTRASRQSSKSLCLLLSSLSLVALVVCFFHAVFLFFLRSQIEQRANRREEGWLLWLTHYFVFLPILVLFPSSPHPPLSISFYFLFLLFLLFPARWFIVISSAFFALPLFSLLFW
jgi:hypothetical protein